MTARQQAVLDIKDELRRSNKCFLVFRRRLNPIMKDLVNDYIKAQEEL